MSNKGAKYRTNRFTRSLECVICGQPFRARGGAKTCSPRCRKKLSRITNGTERREPVTDIRSVKRDTSAPSAARDVFGVTDLTVSLIQGEV